MAIQHKVAAFLANKVSLRDPRPPALSWTGVFKPSHSLHSTGLKFDLLALTALFLDDFGMASNWTVPHVTRVGSLDTAGQTRTARDLKAAGHVLEWAREAQWRELKREGWRPVLKPDAIGRPGG